MDQSDHFALISKAGDGKSTFGAQMSPEYLVADLDGRWDEQDANLRGAAHVIRESETLAVVREMENIHKSGAKIGTVIFDSGTAILDFIQSKGRLEEAAAKAVGQKYNLDNVHRLKADTMRTLRMVALKFHCNVLWIFHLEDGMLSGKARVRTTIPVTELERLKSNLNAILTIVKDPKSGMRGIRIEWSRYNGNVASGQIIWDTDGMWKGVPARIHTFIRHYKGTEGYNGNVYSIKFLMKFLSEKGVDFLDANDLKDKLGIGAEPYWWDRAAWAVFMDKALKPAA